MTRGLTAQSQEHGRAAEWLTTTRFLALAAVVIVVAALFRLQGIHWDNGTHLHPDERYLTMVVSSVRFPGENRSIAPDPDAAQACGTLRECLSMYWDTALSPLNPQNYDAYGSFVYGTFPLFTTRAIAGWLDQVCLNSTLCRNAMVDSDIITSFLAYDSIHLVGRALSATMDLATLVGLIWLGCLLYDRLVGLLAGALYAAAVLPVQHAHFFVVDNYVTVFVLWTLVFCVVALRRNQRWYLLPAGLTTGLAVSSKASAWPLAGIVALTGVVLASRHPSDSCHDVPEYAPSVATRRRVLRSAAALVLSGLVAALTFRTMQPYAFTGPGFLDVAVNPKWFATMQEIRDLMSGQRDVPFGHQWTARTPIVFPWRNLVFWGLGLPLGLSATVGWAAAGWDLIHRRRVVHLVPWVWATAYFLYQGTQWVKSMRYLLPIYPVLALLAAWWIVRVARRAGQTRGKVSYLGSIGRTVARSVPFVVVLLTVAWCLAFTAIYRQPTTRVQASRWMVENVPTAIRLRTVDGSLINVPLPPGSVLSAAEEGRGASRIETHLAPAQDLTITAIVLPKVVGLGQVGSPTLAAELLGSHVVTEVHLPETGTVEVVLELDTPVQIAANAPVTLYLSLLEGADVALDTSVVANEHWDDPLPLRVDDKDPFWDWYRGLRSSADGQLALYDLDSVEKRFSLLSWLDEADYIVLSSNRLYASIPRLPMRYPLTTAYYNALFDGSLGFTLEVEFVSYPALGPCQFPDQENPFTPQEALSSNALPCSIALPPAEEAYSVYDHPTVYIFRKTEQYSRAKAQLLLPRSLTDAVRFVTPREATSADSGGSQSLVASPRFRAEQEAGGTWSRLFDWDALQNRFPRLGIVLWALMVTLLGWMAYPWLSALVPDLRLSGYGLARIVGLLTWSYCSWLLASLHIVPQTRVTLWLLLALMLALTAWQAYRHRDRMSELIRREWRDIVLVDVLFVGLYLIWVGVRWANPDLWHPFMGGEKPMDFAYFNAVVRSTWFPPYDPWFAGGTLNYYYFGFVIVGSLTEALGIVPSVAYNLAVPTLFALTGIGAYTLASTLAGGNVYRGRRAGLWGIVLVLLIGNLGNLRSLVIGLVQVGSIEFESLIPGYPEAASLVAGLWKVLMQGARLPFRPEWSYWDATRIIPPAEGEVGAINEFPAFTFLYADLHAHMMALPLTQAALGVALQWALGAVRGNRSALHIAPDAVETAPRPPRPRMDLRNHLGGLLPVPGGSILLAGLVGGALRATNTWDYPTYMALMATGWLIGLSASRNSGPKDGERTVGTRVLSVLLTPLLLLGCAEALFRPYTANYSGAYAAFEVWEGSRTPLSIYLWMYVQFLFPLSAGALAAVARLWHRATAYATDVLLASAALVLFVAVSLVVGVGYLGIHISWLAIPLGTIAASLVVGAGESTRRRVLWFWVGTALALSLMVEGAVLKGDLGRMNTVFKFHLQIWMLLGLCAAVFVERIIFHGDGVHLVRRPVARDDGSAKAEGLHLPAAYPEPRVRWSDLGSVAMAILLVCAGLYPALAIPAKIRDRWVPGAPHTLNGMAYMTSAIRYEWDVPIPLVADFRVIRWLQEHVEGSPTIIEALADAEYRWGNRMSIYTGLPSVVGWRWHQVQQRMVMPPGTVEARQQDVRTFYNTQSPDLAEDILERYDVRYVILTPYEQAYMAPEGMSKFPEMLERGVLQVAYEDELSVVYQVINR